MAVTLHLVSHAKWDARLACPEHLFAIIKASLATTLENDPIMANIERILDHALKTNPRYGPGASGDYAMRCRWDLWHTTRRRLSPDDYHELRLADLTDKQLDAVLRRCILVTWSHATKMEDA